MSTAAAYSQGSRTPNAPDEINVTTTSTTTHEQQQQQQRLRNEAGQREAAMAAVSKANGNVEDSNNDDGDDDDDDEDIVPLRNMRNDDSDDSDAGEHDARRRDEAYSSSGAATATTTATSKAAPSDSQPSQATQQQQQQQPQYPACAQCGRPVQQAKPPQTINGPLHPGCVWEYKFLHQPRCHYCDIRFRDHEATEFVKDPDTGALYHRTCARLVADGVPYERPSKSGYVRKLAIARSKFTRKNWKVRFFVLAPADGKATTTAAAGGAGSYGGIRYYVSDPSGKVARPKNNALGGSAGGGATDEQADDDEDNNNSNSDSDSDHDATSPDAVERRAKEEARLTKGYVRLDQRSRLITQPSLSLYRGSATPTPTHTELAIVFYDSADSKVERRLLFQCADVKERLAWLRALEAYIHIVDDPSDYKKKKAATASDKAVEQAAAAATQAK